MNDRCPHCSALILPTDKFCPQCGAALDAQYKSIDETPYTTWQPGSVPATIDELRAFCAYNHMPLKKMRFFVGEDYRQPRAFGIYQDGSRFVVYKNKDDGSRAVRYQGPDEAHAVYELYAKLLDECERRGIMPGGVPRLEPTPAELQRAKRERRQFIMMAVAMVIVLAVISFFVLRYQTARHAHDGYYRYDGGGLYYHYGDDWYYDDDYGDWVIWDDGPYDDFEYLGSDYDSGWGYSDFEDSEAWEELHDDSTSESDYSSWDSNDTDWSSDW